MTSRQPTTVLDDPPVSVRVKLAATWTSLMFVYVYVDILNFFTPGVVERILDGRVHEFDLSQTFSTSALLVMSIPSLMAVASVTLPARASRITNIAAAGSGLLLKGQALGGYIRTRSGRDLIYALVVNNAKVADIDAVAQVFQDEGTISALLWRDY